MLTIVLIGQTCPPNVGGCLHGSAHYGGLLGWHCELECHGHFTRPVLACPNCLLGWIRCYSMHMIALYSCTHALAHTHLHTRICTHAFAHTHLHTRTCTHAFAHMHLHTRTCTHAFAHTHLHTRTCTHAFAPAVCWEEATWLFSVNRGN